MSRIHDGARLRGAILLALVGSGASGASAIFGCGGKLEGTSEPTASTDAGRDATTDASCPEQCFTPERLQAMATAWRCVAPAEANRVPTPLFDDHGCMDIAEMSTMHCCTSPCSSGCTQMDIAEGPRFAGGQCCYRSCGASSGGSSCGRPLIVDSAPRVAGTALREDWSKALPCSDETEIAVDDIDATTRSALAHAWLEDARMEHASIGSFSRFTLQLLAAGAPPELLIEAQRATLDEIEHARRCFALASRYAGAQLGPGAFELTGVLSSTGLADAVRAAVHEGCIGETLGAAIAQAQVSSAKDAVVRDALGRIADDEMRHAVLAWRFVAWALRGCPPDLREPLTDVVNAALEDAWKKASLPSTAEEDARVDREIWRAHGRLTPKEIEDVVATTLRTVIEPCVHVLLDPRRAR